ncbi:MAG: methyl-accepting chemotaxis protein [Parcubacteria group bacterium Greene0416_14]|nr:MAG: methyl-accepting chemotaxis protein [Parcubacteria group bacterium Greene0416_14]
MWELFWIQNSRYVLEIFIAFLMVTAGWIYLDGWMIERKGKTLLRAVGFFVLTLWGFIGAAPHGFIGFEGLNQALLVDLIGLLGFGFILASLLMDPVPIKPGKRPPLFFGWILEKQTDLAIVPLFIATPLKHVLATLAPLIGVLGFIFTQPKIWLCIFSSLITALLYIHYSYGIQSEWKHFYRGFLFLSIGLGVAILSLLESSSNVLIARFAADNGLFWIIENFFKFIGAVSLGAWAWGFIRFRIFPQIFSSFVALSFLIFVTTTIFYTGFLLNKTQQRATQDLETNVKTLEFALSKVKESAILAARIASTNPQTREAVRANDKDALFNNLNALMFENETDFMLAVNTGGEVIMRAEDRDRFGDSIAQDPVVWRALDGKAVVTTQSEEGVTIPTISIRAASPIVDTREDGRLEIIGAVVTGYLMDIAFVDGVKEVTSLDVTIFAKDVAAATTFTLPNTSTRLIGTREVDTNITTAVLTKGERHTGTASVLNQPYLASYIPILDVEETQIGMLFTGRSQASILAVASDTLRLTFSLSIIFMLLSILPLAWLARFITHNQQV